MFHAHRDRLLAASREELSDLIASSIATPIDAALSGDAETSAEIVPGSRLFLGVVGCRHDLDRAVSRVIIEQGKPAAGSPLEPESSKNLPVDLVVNLGAPGKKAEIALSNDLLPRAIDHARAAIASGRDILVQDDACKDASVGCMMVLLWTMIGDDGTLRSSSDELPKRESPRGLS